VSAVLIALVLVGSLIRQASEWSRRRGEVCLAILVAAMLVQLLSAFTYQLLDANGYESSARVALSFVDAYILSFATLTAFAVVVVSLRKRAVESLT
jgi:hypothetical protein